MTVLEKIDKLRIERGWSINYLAMEAMLTQSTLNNLYMRGAEPKLSTLRAICNAFGITLAEFFAEETSTEKTDKSNIDLEIQQKIATLNSEQKKALIVLLNSIK